MGFMIVSIIHSATEVLLPVLYVLTVALYGLSFFREEPLANAWKTRFLFATFATHFVLIGLHTVEHGHCMVTTAFEMMSLIAFTVLTVYAIIELRTKIRETGFFLIGFAGLFQMTSAVMMKVSGGGTMNPILANPGIGAHVSAAIFGFGGIAISAVYGLLYLLLYRELKRGSYGSFYRHLPSLESLETLSVAASSIGFIFLTISIGLGAFWLPRVYGHFSYLDPKLLATALIWCTYAVVLVSKFVIHLDGRRVISLSLGGFVLALFSLTIVNAFFSAFHRFY